MTRRAVAVTIAGHDYKIRSDADPADLRRVAGYVDAAMQKIRRQTDTHDSFDVAVLTCLNLARDILALRDRLDGAPTAAELGGLADLIEAAMAPPVDLDDDSDAAADASVGDGASEVHDEPAEAAEATVHSVDMHLERIAERAAEAAQAADSAATPDVVEEPGVRAAGEAKR